MDWELIKFNSRGLAIGCRNVKECSINRKREYVCFLKKGLGTSRDLIPCGRDPGMASIGMFFPGMGSHSYRWPNRLSSCAPHHFLFSSKHTLQFIDHCALHKYISNMAYVVCTMMYYDRCKICIYVCSVYCSHMNE